MDSVSEPPPFDALEDRILPWSQVKVICGLSRTTVWRMQKTGDFPACVQVSQNRVGWWQSELLAWRRARTPRRLPEPRAIVAAPEPVRPPVRRTLEEPRQSPAPEAATGSDQPVRSRRKRKSGVPENQAAFDFGG
ncbi:helix-turn-helix transcriptional regulator [Brevundimonas nasdae]|uniref:AlpA family phage regulatory protein n=1 Tax=Brevundimonas nasdae TaxID=172043 RepID=A0ABX8TIZ4_9CAUL|nr:AlpA family phage regulatory protein [Brevundimonas nasdae]QYC10007.1 AlpA family phage regulatory protein [Brevundimonas nasdae]QYC12797.1 AlpA family phage regulatory protein [Brevundimonas nasdae]